MNKGRDNKITKIADLIGQEAKDLLGDRLSGDELDKYIKGHTLDYSVKPKDEDSILYQQDTEIGSRSNILAVTGKSKSRKSSVVAGIISSMFAPGKNVLGFVSSLSGQDRVLHIDTEQSYSDYYRSIELMLAGAKIAKPPATFTSLWTRDADVEAQSDIVDYLIEKIKPRVLILDGVTDFVYDINDHKETQKFGRRVMKWSSDYDCLVIVVIHTTKTTGYMTGALGTWFEKKSETVIKVEKPDDQQEISNISCQYSRGLPFKDFTIMYDQAAAHYNVVDESKIVQKNGPPSKKDPTQIGEDKHHDILNRIFLAMSTVSDSDIVTKISTHAREVLGDSIGKQLAGRFRDYYRDKVLIYQDPERNWQRVPQGLKPLHPKQTDDLPF
jgi:hypothetical protein